MFKKLYPLLLVAAVCPFVAAGQSTGAKSALGVTVSRAAALAVPAGAVSQDTTYDFNWSFTPNLPACVSTDTACYDGFILTNTTSGAVVGTPAQIVPGVLSYSYSPAGGIPYGTTSFSMVAHGFDANGVSIVSTTPATVSVTVNVTSLNSVTGLQGKAQ